MLPRRKRVYRKHRAGVLVVSMIFTLVFSALAVSLAAMSGTNVQIASNHHNINAALTSAQSGQEVMRYWLSDVLISSATPTSQYFSAIITALQTNLSNADVSNVTAQNDGSISTVMLDLTEGCCFDGHIRIDSGDPTLLLCSVTIEGILLIESPNKVTFGNNVALRGIIVADSDVVSSDPSSRCIDFMGNFSSESYPSGSEFDAVRQEEGSSILAPGFCTTFNGNFSTLEGVVAVSGVHFSGNMDAQIKGTIINYSDSSTVVEGNSTMNFDREASTKIPAGFDLYRELDYNPSTYSEASL